MHCTHFLRFVFWIISHQYPTRKYQIRLPLLRLLAISRRLRTACRAGRIGGIGTNSRKQLTQTKDKRMQNKVTGLTSSNASSSRNWSAYFKVAVAVASASMRPPSKRLEAMLTAGNYAFGGTQLGVWQRGSTQATSCLLKVKTYLKKGRSLSRNAKTRNWIL